MLADDISPQLDEEIMRTCDVLSLHLDYVGVEDSGIVMTLVQRYANLYAQVQIGRVVDDMARNGSWSASREVLARLEHVRTMMPLLPHEETN